MSNCRSPFFTQKESLFQVQHFYWEFSMFCMSFLRFIWNSNVPKSIINISKLSVSSSVCKVLLGCVPVISVDFITRIYIDLIKNLIERNLIVSILYVMCVYFFWGYISFVLCCNSSFINHLILCKIILSIDVLSSNTFWVLELWFLNYASFKVFTS